MQDRFKFSVWDKSQKQMHSDDFIITCKGKVHRPTVASLEMGEIKNNPDELAYRWLKFDQAEDTSNDLILIQCTGLKDKNGELVYFNDFIKLDDGIICIVKQIEDINDIEYGKVVAIPVFCLNKKYQTRYIPTVIAESEKVGSIYKTPELLEEKKCS